MRIKALIIETTRGFWDLLTLISSKSIPRKEQVSKTSALEGGQKKKANDHSYKSIKSINKLRWLLTERELPLEFSFTNDPELYCLKSY